jgi:hypothetical protein
MFQTAQISNSKISVLFNLRLVMQMLFSKMDSWSAWNKTSAAFSAKAEVDSLYEHTLLQVYRL